MGPECKAAVETACSEKTGKEANECKHEVWATDVCKHGGGRRLREGNAKRVERQAQRKAAGKEKRQKHEKDSKLQNPAEDAAKEAATEPEPTN